MLTYQSVPTGFSSNSYSIMLLLNRGVKSEPIKIPLKESVVVRKNVNTQN